MDLRLTRLISDYQKAVGRAVELMSDAGIRLPSSNRGWVESGVAPHGELKEGIPYQKHGYGCLVKLPGGEVDFDFGEKGETDEFDEWRLSEFSRCSSQSYGLDEGELSCLFNEAIKKKILVEVGNGMYFVADSMRLLSESDARILAEGCPLPHYARDCIQRLSSQCFDSADLMYKHFIPLDSMWSKHRKLSPANVVKFRVYLLSWLGYLHATSEGFNMLRVRLLLTNKRPSSFLQLIAQSDEIGSLVKQYADDLRVLRNDTFHLRTDGESIRRFFSDDGERLDWARKLHSAFGQFFSRYRILAEMHYFDVGRSGESQIRAEQEARRKRRSRNLGAV